MKSFLNILCIAILVSACKNDDINQYSTISQSKTAKVEVKIVDGKYELLVNAQPFYINGAGLEFGSISSLAEHNGNSFRTWTTANAKKVLDTAHKYGLKVTMGLEVGRERHGFDYNDPVAIRKQKESIREQVLQYKDHPALLIWAIGNELNLHATNPKVWDAVNDISKMIHDIDSNHITTTTLAGITKQNVNYIKERCQDIDLLSIQLYGNIVDLPKMLKEYDWTGPYIVTEWGATGHWEVPLTSWGAPIEENSTIKAEKYLNRYRKSIEIDTTQCLGSYVFLWGQKQERTPTWYGIFLEDGRETGAVDVMHYIWNNKWPKNRTPQISSFTLDGKTAYENVVLEPGMEAIASAKIIDFEDDAIQYSWEILYESTATTEGGDREDRPDIIEAKILENSGGILKFEVPQRGKYRLFVYADDDLDHAATANIPFLVE